MYAYVKTRLKYKSGVICYIILVALNVLCNSMKNQNKLTV